MTLNLVNLKWKERTDGIATWRESAILNLRSTIVSQKLNTRGSLGDPCLRFRGSTVFDQWFVDPPPSGGPACSSFCGSHKVLHLLVAY